MKQSTNRLFKDLDQVFLKAKFTRIGFDCGNIDEIYNNNLNIWYYFQSDCVTKKDGNTEVNSKLDTINNVILLNPENFIFCKTQKGFSLTEVKFIEAERKSLLLIDVDKLSFSEQNQMQFYSEYLSKTYNYIIKPQEEDKISDTNIILKIAKEIEFFNQRIAIALALQERQNYLILSKKPLFDIDALKQFLIENELNVFAKTEISQLCKRIDNIEILKSQHNNLPQPLNFNEYNYSGINGKNSKGCVSGNLFYFLNISKKIVRINEKEFIEKYDSIPFFNSLNAGTIWIRCSEIRDLFNENIESEQMLIHKTEELKKELHNDYFKGNAIEIWQSMFNEFKITKSQRTDIDFMFQVMKYNNLIHKHIGFVDIQDWINKEYDINFDKIKYTNPNSKSNVKRMSTYNLINSNKKKV
ncbi:hypothetical protein ACM55K_08515 [Flavobacterium sp. LT1R49]|uniref:hypothetical protein n=1 Tax=Flavobacterium arabinosi TaxID=3398737 RepID=UPI003A886E9A